MITAWKYFKTNFVEWKNLPDEWVGRIRWEKFLREAHFGWFTKIKYSWRVEEISSIRVCLDVTDDLGTWRHLRDSWEGLECRDGHWHECKWGLRTTRVRRRKKMRKKLGYWVEIDKVLHEHWVTRFFYLFQWNRYGQGFPFHNEKITNWNTCHVTLTTLTTTLPQCNNSVSFIRLSHSSYFSVNKSDCLLVSFKIRDKLSNLCLKSHFLKLLISKRVKKAWEYYQAFDTTNQLLKIDYDFLAIRVWWCAIFWLM
jgi:hypothetical protein